MIKLLRARAYEYGQDKSYNKFIGLKADSKLRGSMGLFAKQPLRPSRSLTLHAQKYNLINGLGLRSTRKPPKFILKQLC